MSSSAESELGALFITVKELINLRQTLIKMRWPQPPSPIQTDNSTAVGVVNQTIVPWRIKSMDVLFQWLHCRKSQGKFRFYWSPGAKIGLTTVPNITLHYITNHIVQHMQGKTTHVPPVVSTGFPFTYFSFKHFPKHFHVFTKSFDLAFIKSSCQGV